MNWFSLIALVLAGCALGLAIGGVDWWPIVVALVAMACSLRGARYSR